MKETSKLSTTTTTTTTLVAAAIGNAKSGSPMQHTARKEFHVNNYLTGEKESLFNVQT